MLHASLLKDRSLVALGGNDVRTFLQGLITNDIDRLTPDHAIYAALLTPQGKILFDFILAEREGRILVDCAGERAAGLIKRLTVYRLRAKVEIALAPDLHLATLWNDDGKLPAAPAGVLSVADPRLPALGLRLIGPRGSLDSALNGIPQGDYHAFRLGLGVPDSADLSPDSVLALDAGLEELNGVSFRKGCYVGQEVTARMKHRATARRRFVIAESPGGVPLPGTALDAEGRELGTLATGMDGRALALVRLDRLGEAEQAGAHVSAAGQPLTLKKPGWLGI